MLQLPRVLLVADAGDERETYAASFQRHGFCTLLAESASDAYRMASELPPAAVVTTVRLGGTEDGIGLARRLKAHDALRGVPVVMLTTGAISYGHEMAARATCDLLVPKPCQPDALSSVVTSLIRRHNIAGPAVIA
jgi:DNA-binding response OmpR family regulator